MNIEDLKKIPPELVELMSEMMDLIPQDLKDTLSTFLNSGITLAQARGIEPDTIEAMYNVAYSLYQSRDFEKARQIFHTLVMLNHYEFRFYFGLASTYQMLKEYNKAVQIYGIAHMFKGDDPSVPFHSAYCHSKLGNFDAARSGYSYAANLAEGKPQFASLKDQAAKLEKIMERKLAGQGGGEVDNAEDVPKAS